MKKTLCACLFLLLGTSTVQADGLFLFIGDGMGQNHVACAEKETPLFMTTLPVKATFTTFSANNDVTDSAAAATAFSCGQKTNNSSVGMLPFGKPCVTLTEDGVAKGFFTGVYTTDNDTGATPSSFYAHTMRSNHAAIRKDLEQARKRTDIVFDLPDLKTTVQTLINRVKRSGKDFFVVIEQGKIDVASHKNNLDLALDAVFDLDDAIRQTVMALADMPDATVVVVADHETGGLTNDCRLTSTKHTDTDVPLFAVGKHANIFADVRDNTDVYDRIKAVLFPDTP